MRCSARSDLSVTQSNMVFPVKYAYDPAAEVASVDPEGFGANFRF
eukprot:COSAG02_NODE_13700_length_1359_cov_2.944444_3_plen_44_part_01